MHDGNGVLVSLEVVPHARDGGGDQGEGGWMMVRERGVEDAPVHLVVTISGALGTELPDSPVLAVLAVEEA